MTLKLPTWLKSRRALLAELAEERQTAAYFRAIVKREFEDIKLVDLNLGPEGLRMAMRGQGTFAGLLCQFLLQGLKACGAENYVELQATHPDVDGLLTFTLQRHGAGTLTPGAKAALAEKRAADLERTFDLRWKADMRAIKRWQAEAPGRSLTWPDHADLVVWLLHQLEARAAVLAGARIVHDAGKRYRIEHPDGWTLQPVGRVTIGQAKAICEAILPPVEAAPETEVA